ncbi:hypothetical protein GCM10007377_02140 [Galliscardovia ingluviei]|uniref:Regulatory protein RecX n=1 Tax=Galliscardovia ingluviei TaxID=1769422 RepID=A0A8J3AF01_9BIFI|nr:regulatory protein RecX [Galliscardovia ingluviei]GGI12674.1 hypothetical protein GCM10007377_02140 [Galliscardovia ingluviei]
MISADEFLAGYRGQDVKSNQAAINGAEEPPSHDAKDSQHIGLCAESAIECKAQQSHQSYFDQFIDEDFDACKEAALRLLDAAPRSSGALRKRLEQKEYDDEVIERVIERLTAIQLLDDYEYAQSVCRQCVARMMGAAGARMTLLRKDVDAALASQVVQEMQETGAFDEAAWQLGHQSARKTQGLDSKVRKRRFWSAAGRKGHNPAIITQIAHELFDE